MNRMFSVVQLHYLVNLIPFSVNPFLKQFFFFQVQDYLRRFESIPDMLELDHLTVSGDVTFGKNVSLKVCC